MNEKFKIESGVPMPTRTGGRRCVYPLGKMSVGDSFLLSKDDLDRVRTAVSYYGKRNHKKFSIRKVDPVTKEYRCWRIA